MLHISVWKENLNKEVLVRPDGGISFPLMGDLKAAENRGRDREEITQRLAKFIPDPFVSVSVLKTAGNRIYVIGK
jgi:polysaccharide export outer membrane protein